jgi:hypothetical protein
MILEIPLTNDPFKTFQIELDGNDYQFKIRWNDTDQSWFLDLVGVTNGIALYGLKLISGVNILGPHGFASLGELYIADFEDRQTDPTLDDLGDRYKLLYVPREDL